MSRTEKPQRFFYGWIIVALSFITMAIGFNMRNSFGIFYVEILKEFGWTRADTAFAFSLNLIVAGIGSLVAGKLVDTFGSRIILPLGGFISSLGLFGMSFIQTKWQFYLFFGIIFSFGLSLTWWVPQGVILSNWFLKKRSTAFGIALSGMGIGGIIILPAIQYLIIKGGWRITYIEMALVVLLTIVPLNAVFNRYRPEDMGLLPDGDRSYEDPLEKGDIGDTAKVEIVIKDSTWVNTQWDLSTAFRTLRFWLLFANNILVGFAVNTIAAHQVAHTLDSGFSPMFASAVLGLTGAVGSAGSVVGGFFSDRLSRENAYLITNIFSIIGIIFLFIIKTTPYLPFLYAFVLCFGFSQGANFPISTAIHADIFAGRNFGVIYGFLNVGFGIGGGIGPYLAGFIFDRHKSYNIAFSLVILALILISLNLFIIAPSKVITVRRRSKNKMVSVNPT